MASEATQRSFKRSLRPSRPDATPRSRNSIAAMTFLPSSGPSSGEASSRSDLAADALAFLDEATDGASRLRAPLRIEVIRALSDEDISGGFLTPAPPPTLRETKSSHHSLAKLIASGRGNVEASRITGYSPSYIARLRGDAAFQELILHYSTVEDIASTDFLGAMREVGLDLLNELRERVERDPGTLSVGQLHEGIKLLLVEPMKSEALRSGLGAGVAPVSITFVASATPQASGSSEGVLIEGERAK